MIPAGEPGHVGGVADHGGGGERADAEEIGQAGARRADRGSELLLRLAHLLIQPPHVRQEVGGKAGAGLPGDAGRRDAL